MFQSIKCIEFIGLPGCGKTSVANEIIETLRLSSAQPIANRADVDRWLTQVTLLTKIYWMLTHLHKLLTNWWVVLQLNVQHHPFKFDILLRGMKLPIIDIFMLQYLRKHPDCLCVLDQGAIQNVWSMMAHSLSVPEQAIQNLTQHQVYRPYKTLYIYIRCTPALASDRISHRTHGNSRFEDLPNEQRYMVLDNSGISLNIICESILIAGENLIAINAEDSIQGKSQLIIQHYESIRKSL